MITIAAVADQDILGLEVPMADIVESTVPDPSHHLTKIYLKSIEPYLPEDDPGLRFWDEFVLEGL